MKPRVFVDFQNADPLGRVRLNTIGGLKDVASLGTTLQSGTLLELYEGETTLEGVADYSKDEKMWVAVVDWEQFRPDKQPLKAREISQLGVELNWR